MAVHGERRAEGEHIVVGPVTLVVHHYVRSAALLRAQDMTYEEIAGQLNVGSARVRQLLDELRRQARVALRDVGILEWEEVLVQAIKDGLQVTEGVPKPGVSAQPLVR